jgi:hypothetical protein
MGHPPYLSWKEILKDRTTGVFEESPKTIKARSVVGGQQLVKAVSMNLIDSSADL